MPEDKSELRKRWDSAAPGWAKWEHVLAIGLSDATETMLDMAGVQPGMTVLDVACGAGSASLQAAERVGASGKVVSSDISETMLVQVRENAERLGVTNIETLHCPADELDSDSNFDAAICRLGLMLFPQPVEAGSAICKALKSGMRFSPLVFTTPGNNPFLSGPMQILLRHAGKQPPPPGGPGIFALGAPGVLQGTLEECGFAEVQCQVLPAKLSLDSASEALEMMRTAFGNFRAVVAELTEDKQAAAWAEVGQYLGEFQSASGWQTELEVVIGTGMAPR
jgi:ubiquinone/menaquinone biosynthesis C-methylase UbiE